MVRRFFLPCLLLLSLPNLTFADAGIEFYEKKVRPVLAIHCAGCHVGTENPKAGLLLDSRATMLIGGDSGPVIVPGEPDQSLLLKAVSYVDSRLKMPPKGKLPNEAIADLRKWVEMGAPAPEGEAATVKRRDGIDIEAGREFWSFRPPTDHPIPDVRDPEWTRDPIDNFILAKLEENGLPPAGDADRSTLLRRLTFNLTGLPPAATRLDDFLTDESPDAFERATDRLLASPAFGERWGRHWLDVARYAESTGGGRTMLLPQAWRYRDYVIRSINADKPFDQFLREQVAGDLMPTGDSVEQRQDRLIATAFLAMGPTNYERQDKEALEMDVIDEQLELIGRSMLGMTIGCARCHDHKFDPIPTSDYYAMAGILKSTQTMIHNNVSNWVEKPLPLPPEQEKAFQEHQQKLTKLRNEIKALKAKTGKAQPGGPVDPKSLPGIVIDDPQAEQIGKWVESTYHPVYVGQGYLHDGDANKGEKALVFRASVPKADEYEVRLAYAPGSNRADKVPVTVTHAAGEKKLSVSLQGLPPIDGLFVSLGKYRFEPGEPATVHISNAGTKGHVVIDAVQIVTPAEAKQKKPDPKNEPDTVALLAKKESELKDLEKSGPQRPTTMCVVESNKVEDCRICIRGNYHNQGESVDRGVLQVATYDPFEIPTNQSGRLQLAEWLTSPSQPLTPRVIVNQTWHHIFGVGIVRTTDNFGTTGEMPTHPELLDDLALRFVREGWSMKDLVRSMVLSRTYGLTSEGSGGENRLFARANRQRLDAESIRDTVLVNAGLLDRTMEGSTIRPGTNTEYGYRFNDTRRSVYTPVFRNQLHELFEAFDFPDPNLPSGPRNVSTVATQALFLLNNPMMIEWSKAAAERSLSEDGTDADRLERAYRRALSRSPTPTERELALNFLARAENDEQRQSAWTRLHQTLFACVDFRYVK